MAAKHGDEVTLDPRDWAATAELGKQMVEDMCDYLSTVRERPVWDSDTATAKQKIREALPEEPQGEQAAYRDFQELVRPFPLGNIHPRFWGWVVGTGTPTGMLAELLAAGMNPNNPGFDHAATWLEELVLDWFKELMGFPQQAGGILVSGASMANLIGLAVARKAKAPFDIRGDGLAGQRPLTIYTSDQAHNSVQKAIELLGLGNRHLRRIASDDQYRILVPELRAYIEDDRSRGYTPICVVGMAGTVNTGAFDDLGSLADLCRDEGLWLHVDGAFGALAALSPRFSGLVKGLERADSLAFDLHKWLHIPYEAGCVLVRNRADHKAGFSVIPDYLRPEQRGVLGNSTNFTEYGLQLSRGFRALKVWFSLKAHGLGTYRRLIEQNIDQAAYLGSLIEASPNLELAAPIPLNIVCFRYIVAGLNAADLNSLNAEILYRIQESGQAMPSNTVLNGAFVMRVSITNHRTRYSDLDAFIAEVERVGSQVYDEFFDPSGKQRYTAATAAAV